MYIYIYIALLSALKSTATATAFCRPYTKYTHKLNIHTHTNQSHRDPAAVHRKLQRRRAAPSHLHQTRSPGASSVTATRSR